MRLIGKMRACICGAVFVRAAIPAFAQALATG